jgi:hypothetical protein
MRKAIVVGIVCVGILAACSDGESTPAPTVTKTVEAPAPVTPALDTSEMVSAIRGVAPDFYDVDSAQIIDTASLICQTLREGAPLEDVGAIAEESLGRQSAAALIAGAITYLCPDQEYKLG